MRDGRRTLRWLVVMIALCVPWREATAGAKIDISEDSNIDIGFRLQTLVINTQRDLDDTDDDFESLTDFRIRRARLRLKANITELVSIFLQSDVTSASGPGLDMRLIDAWIRVKPLPWLSLYVGQFLPPSSRLDVTSPGAFLTPDRPGIAYRALSWGTRAVYGFATTSYPDGDAGLRGLADVRDTGAMLFGSVSATEILHIKYYLAAFDGAQGADRNQLRYTGRLQINLFDPEPGYVVSSTYHGKKKTIALGVSVDAQNAVDTEEGTGREIDYLQYSIDYLVELPLGPGFVTSEGAFTRLDLDDAQTLAGTGRSAIQSQGQGFFVQAGYLFGDVQGWAGYELYKSDADDGRGGYWATRFGLTYLLKGHNAKVMAGYEIFRADRKIGTSNENRVGTFLLGLYVTY